MGNPDVRLQGMNSRTAARLRSRLPDYQDAIRLSRQAHALADPNRVALLVALAEADKPVCVSDLCVITEREQSGVSRNLRILWESGLVERTRWHSLVEYELTPTGERLLAALIA